MRRVSKFRYLGGRLGKPHIYKEDGVWQMERAKNTREGAEASWAAFMHTRRLNGVL